VRYILFHEWDPIGINSIAPNDEYDSYVPAVCSLLMRGADTMKIATQLQDWATNAMGLSQVDEGHSVRIARRLQSLVENGDR
jgi:hypothetical protein